MRPLWLSNAMHCPTGYGNQTALFLPKIKADGHDIALFAFCGVELGVLIRDGIPIFPRLQHPYGNDIAAAHYNYHHADAVITLIDPFVLDPDVYQHLNWIAWAPLDSEPMLPDNATVLQAAKRIWAMSRFGERMLQAAGFTNVDYVPHGVDSQTFKPLDRAEILAKLKQEAAVDLDGKFVVTMNSANKGAPSRKGFFEAFAAFKVFSDNHPDAVLYVHSEQRGIHNGEHLPTIAQMLGIAPEKIVYTSQYHLLSGMLPPSYLNEIYNVSDVLLHTAHGEGFGIPIVEAQMAGCPVIATDFSAMTELCISGWKVPGSPFMYAPGAMHKLPLIPKVIEALEAAYAQRQTTDRAKVRENVIGYDVDTVYKTYMRPALAKIEAGIVEAKAQEAQREQLRQAAQRGVDAVHAEGLEVAR